MLRFHTDVSSVCDKISKETGVLEQTSLREKHEPRRTCSHTQHKTISRANYVWWLRVKS